MKIFDMLLVVSLLTSTFATQDEVYPPFFTASFTATTAFKVGIGKYTMYNFYEDCPQAFRQALDADPDFVMAAWGLANCYDHAMWAEQYQMAGWEAIANVTTDPNNWIEHLYVMSTKQLFDPMIKLSERRANHRQTLRRIVAMTSNKGVTIFTGRNGGPKEDSFVKLLLAQSLVAEANPSSHGYNERPDNKALVKEAQELIQQVLVTHPRSAFAHHLWIHANDHPDLAAMAVSSAAMLPTLVKGESHALHMPSHTYLRLGDFDLGMVSNQNAVAVNPSDDHSKQFLNYCYLNLGRLNDAEELIVPYQESSGSSLWSAVRFHYMTGNYINMYNTAPPFLPNSISELPLEVLDPDQSEENFGTAVWVSKAYAAALFAHGRLALIQGNDTLYEECYDKLQELEEFLADQWKNANLNADMALGNAMYSMLPLLLSQTTTAISCETLKRAADISWSFTDRGSSGYGYLTYPQIPGQEINGQLLLKNSNFELALKEFESSLQFNPNRLPSLLGALEASIGAADSEKSAAYFTLVKTQLENADNQALQTIGLASFETQLANLKKDEGKESDNRLDNSLDDVSSDGTNHNQIAIFATSSFLAASLLLTRWHS